MGTTLLATCHQNGVIVSSDSQTSSGYYISNRAADKITIITDYIVCLRSGSSADTQNIVDLVKNIIEKERIESGKPIEVRFVAQILKNICYNKKLSVNCGFICAGWDIFHGGQVYTIVQGGSISSTPLAFSGSGSIFINSFCDTNFDEDMSEQELENFNIKAISLAIQRDCNSNGIIRVCKISSQGIIKKSFFPNKVFQRKNI